MLASVLTIQVAFALASGAALLLVPSDVFGHSWPQLAAAALVVVLVASAVLGILRFTRAYRIEKIRAQGTANLIDTVLSTSREWLWAVDDQGFFTFSSKTSATMLGYQPWELIGKHCRLVIGPEDLALARQAVQSTQPSDDHVPAGSIVRFRHRDGSLAWAEVSGKIRPATDGHGGGVEGTSRLLPPQSVTEMAASVSRDRIRDMVSSKMMLTAFQPIRNLTTGSLIGAEALSRFVTEDGSGADYWFPEAAAVGLGAELEFAALTAALTAAEELPAHVYVALNISPETCLDPRLPVFLERAAIPLGRIVLELTERHAVDDYDTLATVLAPLRSRGLRVAIDDAGSGFASMRHILQLRPEIIKLDRSLIAGIHDNTGQRALGAAMVEFAKQTGATIVAEGIETHTELDAITALGMSAGQGYLLGRPSIQPKDWTLWRAPIKET
ncbi:hypothetical protein ASG92_20470 [Arthrobacter sp. Soil736]|uniref:sensor domain-containing phosphodiesterase n=1 Tax=Arthrobacter sp. Soil736 TaxID=1736395 RepID=UPI0006F1CC36|nr:EAL domain-containing protein [Arthrobacter sp. Soil736]KRE61766.1 hypothetical protein ASG92_20470 [Arthrobacter sp. Soil736]